MTDQPHNPQPGSGLDKAVAEALEWRYSKLYGWSDAEGQQTLKSLPPFSTNTATAMATLEQLCKLVEEGGRGWTFKLEYCDSGSKVEIYDRTSCIITTDFGGTLAHAAALAMLAALEAEKT